VFFKRHHQARAERRASKRLVVERLDRVHVEHSGIDP